MPFVRITMINVVLAFMIIGSFLVAVIIHEFGHSLVATMLGDPTPRKEGRLSPSLRTQIDPVGTMLCVILAFFPVAAGPVGLGWGKPVKVDPWKLRGGPNFGTLLVTLGGLLMSLVVGVLFSLLLRFIPLSFLNNAYTMRITQLVIVFASVNICLAIFNSGYPVFITLPGYNWRTEWLFPFSYSNLYSAGFQLCDKFRLRSSICSYWYDLLFVTISWFT